MFVGWLVGCLTSQQHASVSQGRICTDKFTSCHTEIEVADQIFYITRSQYTDTGPTSSSADPITPGAWQGSQRSGNFEVTGMTRPRKNSCASGIRTRYLPLSRWTPKITRPTRQSEEEGEVSSNCRVICFSVFVLSISFSFLLSRIAMSVCQLVCVSLVSFIFCSSSVLVCLSVCLLPYLDRLEITVLLGWALNADNQLTGGPGQE